MELKKEGYHCRYVREYLALGEAPHEVILPLNSSLPQHVHVNARISTCSRNATWVSLQKVVQSPERPHRMQVRNVFQQRSRWTKGHFQIFFQPKYCPLFQHQLSVWMRLMYSTGIWSYIVCAICTPFFLVNPLIQNASVASFL